MEKRGHYLWWLKDNQPTVRQTAEGLLRPILTAPPHFETVAPIADRVETHQIWCLEVTAERIGFAAARQIFAIRRIVEPKSATAKASDEISYGITSLDFSGTFAQNGKAIFSSLQHAHKPTNPRDCCLPEFNRFCLFHRDVMLRWFRKPKGIRV